MKTKKKFWEWKKIPRPQNKNDPDAGNAGTERVLELYGTIASESWFDDDVTPEMFREELFSDKGPVTIWLSSPGGDCVAASQIYSMLMDYPDDVTVKIDGIAASAASVIAMAGTTVLMAPTALMMIHNPMTVAMGSFDDMQKAIDMLGEVKESIMNAYEIRTGLSRAKISHMMDSETWMNANKCIELGFADDILKDEKLGDESSAYLFSAKKAEMQLVNSVSHYFHLEDHKPPEVRLSEKLNMVLTDKLPNDADSTPEAFSMPEDAAKEKKPDAAPASEIDSECKEVSKEQKGRLAVGAGKNKDAADTENTDPIADTGKPAKEAGTPIADLMIRLQLLH